MAISTINIKTNPVMMEKKCAACSKRSEQKNIVSFKKAKESSRITSLIGDITPKNTRVISLKKGRI